MKLLVVRIFFLSCKHLKGSNKERQSVKDLVTTMKKDTCWLKQVAITVIK